MPVRITLSLAAIALFVLGMHNYNLGFMLQTGSWVLGRTDLYWIVYLVACAVALLASAWRPSVRLYTLPILVPATLSIAVKAQFFLWLGQRTVLVNDLLVGTLLLHTILLLILLSFWRWGIGRAMIASFALVIYVGLLPTSEQLASVVRIDDPEGTDIDIVSE